MEENNEFKIPMSPVTDHRCLFQEPEAPHKFSKAYNGPTHRDR